VETLDEAPLELKNKNEDIALWNPDIAAALSLVLSPIFGSIIHALNWRSLGDRRCEITSWIWVVVLLVVTAFMSVFVAYRVSNPALVSSYDGLINITALIIWYFISGRQQSKYIAKELSKKYNRKSWFAPICFSIIVIGGLLKLGNV
jgi:hypothetical protein